MTENQTELRYIYDCNAETDPGCDTDDDDDDDEQYDEQGAESKQRHVLGRERQEVVVVRPLCIRTQSDV